MSQIKSIIIAAALCACYFGTAQAAETIKPLQGMSFHSGSTDAVVYFTADKGKCRLVLTVTSASAYAPTRFEEVVKTRKSTLYQVDEASALEFTCLAGAQAMTIETIGLLETRVAPIGAPTVKKLGSLSAPTPATELRRRWYAERYENPRERYGYKDPGYEGSQYKVFSYESPRKGYGYKDSSYESTRERYGYDDKTTDPRKRYGYKETGYENPRDRDESKESRFESPRDDDEREVTDQRSPFGSRVSLHAF